MNRSRTKTGKITQKRGDTLIGTIEKKYKIDLKYRSDAKLSTVLRESGANSMSQLVKMADRTRI